MLYPNVSILRLLRWHIVHFMAGLSHPYNCHDLFTYVAHIYYLRPRETRTLGKAPTDARVQPAARIMYDKDPKNPGQARPGTVTPTESMSGTNI